MIFLDNAERHGDFGRQRMTLTDVCLSCVVLVRGVNEEANVEMKSYKLACVYNYRNDAKQIVT